MKKLSWPLLLTLLLLLVYFVIKWAKPEMGGLHKYLLAATLIGASVVVVRVISFVLFDFLFRRRKGREAPELLRYLLYMLVYPTLFMLIFRLVLDIDVTAALFTSAAVSIIIGLALQDTLGNFFAGISLHIEQPFHIGDWIKADNMQGKVEAITWRMTALRTNNNTMIILPNAQVARHSLEVMPYGNLNRRQLLFPGPYGVPPETVIPLIRETVRTTPNVSPERTPVVRIASFGGSNIDYEILYWVIDYMWVPDMDAKIRERIWYVYGRHGIEIPFPHMQLLYSPAPQTEDTQESEFKRVINQVGIFEPLTEEEKDGLARDIVKNLYAPNETIIRRGDDGDSMFVICRGRAEVRVPSNNGGAQTVAVLAPGDFFGEMALFTGEQRNADVWALEEVELLEIRKGAIEHLFNQNARLAEALSQKIAERQARLAEAASRPGQEKQLQPASILARIKRFFSLS
jgi:small-conductance mechanosensitive channel/CRP-like cAMP-binding protein